MQKSKIISHGMYIPRGIMELDLTWPEKILLSQINYLDRTNYGCYAAYEFLASHCSLTKGTVKKMICQLTARGFIVRVDMKYNKRGLRAIFVKYPEDVKFESMPEYVQQRAQDLKALDCEFENEISLEMSKTDENTVEITNTQVTSQYHQGYQPVTSRLPASNLHINNNINNKIKKKTRVKRAASPFPEDFSIDDKTRQWAKDLGLTDFVINEQINDFIEYFTDGEGSGIKRKNWILTFKGWIRRGMKWGYFPDINKKDLKKPTSSANFSEDSVRRAPTTMPCEFCVSTKYKGGCPFHKKEKKNEAI